MPATPFLDKLKTAEQTCGLYLFHYLDSDESKHAFETLDSDKFPWDTNPKIYGERMPQHAYNFVRDSPSKVKKNIEKFEALGVLEDLCLRLESDFDVEITDVYCNRFQDPTHHIDWHKDNYGSHILVLSLGSQRTVEWRDNKSKKVEVIRPSAGDLYFMPYQLNKTHKHRVCAGEEGEGTRLSFVFFFEAPKYAKKFKISTWDRCTGFVQDVLSNPS